MARAAINEVGLNNRNPGVSFLSGDTTGDPANGHFIPWSPRTLLGVRNTSGGALNITFTPQGTALDIFSPAPRVVSVPAGAHRLFGPFPSLYRQPTDSDRMYVDVTSASMLLKTYVVREG